MAATAPTTGSVFRTQELSVTMKSITEQPSDIVQCTGYGECRSEQVTRSNPISPFPEDRKCITLTSSEEDGMKSHDLHNLVSDSSEEECDSTATPLNFRVGWSTSDTEKMNHWLLTAPILLINPEVRRDEKTVNKELSIDWELDSVLSSEDRLDMEDCELIDDLWGDSLTPCWRSQSTGTQPVLDCRWVEPEYPEVWRISP